jgi:hypothetical protein
VIEDHVACLPQPFCGIYCSPISELQIIYGRFKQFPSLYFGDEEIEALRVLRNLPKEVQKINSKD